MVSRGIWINMHWGVFQRPRIALVLRTRAILRSLKNSLVHAITYTSYGPIDILYTLDGASNYSAIQKLKP
jgi:hypothetical protein